MRPALQMALAVAAISTPHDPTWQHVFRVRDDGRVDDTTGSTIPPEAARPRRADPAPFVSMVREELSLARARHRPDPFDARTQRPRKDRSKAKAARKARKKNRGR